MSWLTRLKKTESAITPALKSSIKEGSATYPAESIEKTGLAVEAANDGALNPDRWCWPHSSAMNTAEVDTFTERLRQFMQRGMTELEAESLVDGMFIRDREQGDWHSCFECTHLTGSGSWRCGNWQQAGIAIRAQDAQIPIDYLTLLQRCDGFIKASYIQGYAGGRGLGAISRHVSIKPAKQDRPLTNDLPNWRELDQAYQAHHFKCAACIAAGRGAGYGLRCGVGAALWSDYSNSAQ